jgi:hypothetical protein
MGTPSSPSLLAAVTPAGVAPMIRTLCSLFLGCVIRRLLCGRRLLAPPFEGGLGKLPTPLERLEVLFLGAFGHRLGNTVSRAAARETASVMAAKNPIMMMLAIILLPSSSAKRVQGMAKKFPFARRLDQVRIDDQDGFRLELVAILVISGLGHAHQDIGVLDIGEIDGLSEMTTWALQAPPRDSGP